MLHLLGGIIALVGTHASRPDLQYPDLMWPYRLLALHVPSSGHASGTTLFYSLLATFIGQELSARSGVSLPCHGHSHIARHGESCVPWCPLAYRCGGRHFVRVNDLSRRPGEL